MKKFIILFLLFSSTVFSQSYYPLDKEPTDTNDTEIPTSPFNFVANNVTQNSADLSWNAATDNIAITGYRIYNNGTLLISVGNITSYILNNLIQSTNYNLTVRAIDAANNESTDSNNQSFTTNTSTDNEAPMAPINLLASNLGETTADLSWTAATDNIAVTGYNIYNNGTIFASVGNITNYSLTNLIESTNYNITVRAFDAANNESTDSNNQEFTTLTPDTENPTAPNNFLASNVQNTTVDLTWTASTDNVAVTGYNIYNNGELLLSIGNVINYTLTGLSTSTEYILTIRAFDAANNESIDSNSQTFTTGFDCSAVTSQPEVDLYEATYGSLSASARYAHDYLVSYLKCENLWDLLDDISTCLDNNYYKLKTSVAKDNIQSGDTGIDLSQYNYNDISLTLDYNDIVTSTNELINTGNSQLRLLLNTTQAYKYVAFHCGSEIVRPSHDISFNTKRTFVLTSNSNNIAVATKDGYLIKANNTNNIGTFPSETLRILDPNKLNFFATGKGLSIEQSKKLASAIKEFNNLMSRSNYNDEVGSYEFIGNSITWGYEPPSNKINNNYPKITSYDVLGKRDATWNTSNLGVSGIRLDQVLAEIQSYDKYGLLTRNPNVDTYAIVSLGTNDFLQNRTATAVKADLDTYTRLLTSAGNKVLIILPHRTTTYSGNNPANYNAEVPKFIDLVEADGNYYNGTNAYDTLVFETGNDSADDTTNSTYWYDGLHPKASYFTLMAPIIAPKLEPIPDTVAPTAPTNFLATNATSNSVDLSWNASTDNIRVTNYRIYNSGSLIASVGNDNTSYKLTGLTPDTSYTLTLRAVDAANNESSNSNSQSFTTTTANTDSYTLDQSYQTSAGVFDANGNLLKTLWSNITQTAGTYDISDFSWNGLDEFGNNVTAQADHYKVIANNATAVWEGVIGNTSDSFTGETVHRHFLPFHDMVIHNGEAYFSTDYTEAWGSVTKASLSKINTRIDIMPGQTVQQATNRIATDGVRLYMAGRKSFSDNITYVQAATFGNLNNFSRYESFQGATTSIYATTFRVTDLVTNTESPRVTGLAVQKSGNWLFVAREKINSLHILHKINGTLNQSLTFTAPKLCKVDNNDNLWMVVNNQVIKYSVNQTNGAITPTGFSITGFSSIEAMAISPDGSTIAVADAGTYHQVKEYNTTTGTLIRTLGRPESYLESPKVYNDKFLFVSKWTEEDKYAGLEYESDGSLWVIDCGNDRTIKFDSNRNYVEEIMYLPAVYSCNVDPNNISRVFGGLREFSVDYSKPLQGGNANNAWSLSNNWSETSDRNSVYGLLTHATTLSNGRTYAIKGTDNDRYEFIELVENKGLRNTGVTFNRWSYVSLRKDGTIFRVVNTGSSGTQTIYMQSITGFDSNNNPILSNETVWASFPISGNLRMAGPFGVAGEITNNDVHAIFNGGHDSGFHFGGIKKGATDLSFRTSMGVVYNQGDPYPPNGEFDLRANVEYRGNVALAIDNYFIWGYNGEFWENGQTNKYNMYHESGLFVKQFGETSQAGLGKAIAGMAGNAFDPKVVKYGNDIYLWHQDESYHAGLHRWKISGLNTLQEFNIKL